MINSRNSLPTFIKVNYNLLAVKKYPIDQIFVAYELDSGEKQLLKVERTLHYRCLKYRFHALSSSAYDKYMRRQKREKNWKDFSELSRELINKPYEVTIDPIIVHYDFIRGKLIVLDGFHRLAIMFHNGAKEIEVALVTRRFCSILLALRNKYLLRRHTEKLR